MKPVTRWTLWQRRWSTLWWSVGVASFIFITLVFYPSFKTAGSALEQSFSSLPKAALGLFGGSADFFSPVGYLNSQIFFLLLPLLLTMLAVSLGASLIAREEQNLTIEMLLARPVSRGRLLLAKATAGTLALATVSLVAMVTVVVCARIFGLDGVPSSSVALASLNCFLLAFCTGAIAFLLAATGRARGAAIGIATLIGFGGYILSSLAGTVHWLHGPSKIFPFNYFQSEAILRQTYHWTSALYFVAAIAVCGILSCIVFRRRDIA
ncbi:MAG TPA: ABC transporter permease subunit [Candidatus Saccharimonadales bacterium]|nr:ABC transporter permease subunit [Candidatus Saccharimonadales bacterium]